MSCVDSSLEAGYEKVAIFVKNSLPSHAARQLESGAWTSKLGPSHDIEHDALSGVEGSEYGSVAKILRRPRPAVSP